jgi:hypothetical protein
MYAALGWTMRTIYKKNKLKNINKNRNVEFETYPQMPLRASMLKLAACEGNMLQAELYDSNAKIFT